MICSEAIPNLCDCYPAGTPRANISLLYETLPRSKIPVGVRFIRNDKCIFNSALLVIICCEKYISLTSFSTGDMGGIRLRASVKTVVIVTHDRKKRG
ncbi:MAG: hypothetical protein V7L31_06745 [Nostoc sp.]|uniref:hypothetical protein n=1 Tax=Nostoc sp. TaxID=1180 RepID=UPI002FF42085